MRTLHRIEKLIDTYMAHLPRAQPSSIKACVIAHRGAHDNNRSIQENTFTAFNRAFELGCYGIELDVHACADEVLVVNHDPTLKRLWGHDVAIDSLTFEELRTLCPELPSLKEVIELYGKRMHLYIELKMPFAAIDALVTTLQPLMPCMDYHLLCLDPTLFNQLGGFPKASCLVVPVHNNVRKLCKISLKNNYGGVLGHYLLLHDRQIKKLRAANQLVGVGFIDSKFSAYRELNRGIRFLFTNNAAEVISSLKS